MTAGAHAWCLQSQYQVRTASYTGFESISTSSATRLITLQMTSAPGTVAGCKARWGMSSCRLAAFR